jgi:Cu/Ag efflux pump CusA
MELRTFADWTMRPAAARRAGRGERGRVRRRGREIQVQLLPTVWSPTTSGLRGDRPRRAKATGVVGAGFIETEAQRIAFKTEGQSLTAEEVGEVLVRHGADGAVRLKDVARVIDGPEPKLGDAAVNGEPGVLLQVWAQYGANTKEVTLAVEAALQELAPAIRSAEILVADPPLFRPASFIDLSIHNINMSLLIGGALVAIVLTLFLFNLRTAFISLTAIPLSLLVAVIVLDQFDVTLNTLTLGGFAIAIGEVVDDAIIDVENIFRRLRQNREAGMPRSAFRVVLDASIEVRSAVVYATFVVALVFIPVLTMSGIQGKLFAPLGVAYILATLASLLVALTVTPALSLLLLANARPSTEPAFLRALKEFHHRVLEGLSGHPFWVLAFPVLLCVAAVPMILSFGGELLPEYQEGNYIIQMSAVRGPSAPESMRIGRRWPRGACLPTSTSRPPLPDRPGAELGEDTVGPRTSAMFQVTLATSTARRPRSCRWSCSTELHAKFPGVKFAVKTFSPSRIEETISGTKAPSSSRGSEQAR